MYFKGHFHWGKYPTERITSKLDGMIHNQKKQLYKKIWIEIIDYQNFFGLKINLLSGPEMLVDYVLITLTKICK